MNRFFDHGGFASTNNDQEEPSNAVEEKEIQTETCGFEENTPQVSLEKGEKGLLITFVPTDMNTIGKIAVYMEKYGSPRSLKVSK